VTSRTAVVAIDAGTTGVRSRAFFLDGSESVSSYREFPQHFPRPGWVEHDANDIWAATVSTLREVIAAIGGPPVAIGVTNQRETVVPWSRRTGEPLARAIVWQDRRTTARCEALADLLPTIRATTGLVLDPYFSATKMEWLLDEGGVPRGPDLCLGTVDSWLVWKLSGGTSFVTDPSNASRTMLFDIRSLAWSDELCEVFGVPREALPEVVPSSGRAAITAVHDGVPAGIPISGIAGDQQAALFGQACFGLGDAKNTYGTGSFVLMNVGSACPAPTDGMLTTVAWTLADGSTAYALEGAIFVTGSAIQWLRDGLRIIDAAAECGPLAESVPDSAGVVVVPAFTGLGSPWWDPDARGAIFGITRGTTRAHLARAVVESIAFQTRDVVDAMSAASGVVLNELKVDGGAAAMDLLLQIQADQLGVDVLRPVERESTAAGAAYLAGIAEGVWDSRSVATSAWRLDRRFHPSTRDDVAYGRWRDAVSRVLTRG